jgi:hypothetical protein
MIRASWKVFERRPQGMDFLWEESVEVVVVMMGLGPQQWLSAA